MTHEQTLLRFMVEWLKDHAPHLEQDAEYKEAADGLVEAHDRSRKSEDRHEDPREEKKGR